MTNAELCTRVLVSCYIKIPFTRVSATHINRVLLSHTYSVGIPPLTQFWYHYELRNTTDSILGRSAKL